MLALQSWLTELSLSYRNPKMPRPHYKRYTRVSKRARKKELILATKRRASSHFHSGNGVFWVAIPAPTLRTYISLNIMEFPQ